MENPKCTFTVNKSDLLAIRHLQCFDESRMAISGVHFECFDKTGVLLVATNGRLLGVLKVADNYSVFDEHKNGKEFSFTVDYPTLKHLKTPKGFDLITVTVGAMEVEFSAGQEKFTYKRIEQLFPVWRQVVPQGEFKPCNVNLNLTYLEMFKKVSDAIHYRDRFGNHPLKIRSHGDPDLAHSVFLSQNDRFYGVIMPMRTEIEPQVPDWCKVPEPPTKEEQEAAALQAAIKAGAVPPHVQQAKAEEKPLDDSGDVAGTPIGIPTPEPPPAPVSPEKKIPKGMLARIKRSKAKKKGKR